MYLWLACNSYSLVWVWLALKALFTSTMTYWSQNFQTWHLLICTASPYWRTWPHVWCKCALVQRSCVLSCYNDPIFQWPSAYQNDWGCINVFVYLCIVNKVATIGSIGWLLLGWCQPFSLGSGWHITSRTFHLPILLVSSMLTIYDSHWDN